MLPCAMNQLLLNSIMFQHAALRNESATFKLNYGTKQYEGYYSWLYQGYYSWLLGCTKATRATTLGSLATTATGHLRLLELWPPASSAACSSIWSFCRLLLDLADLKVARMVSLSPSMAAQQAAPVCD